MSSANAQKLLVITLITSLLFTMAVPLAFAESGDVAGPDMRVIMGATGSPVGRANVYLDSNLVGTTDSHGNITFKSAPAAGNHTLEVSAKGIKTVDMSTDFSGIKPLVVKAEGVKGKNLSAHVTDGASKKGLAGVSIYNNKYLVGTTDANGDLNMANFPLGLYLVKLQKDGYKDKTTILIVLSDRKQSFTLTPK